MPSVFGDHPPNYKPQKRGALLNGVPIAGDLKLGGIQDFLDEVELVFELREKNIPFHDSFNQREIKVGTKGEGLLINLRAAADEHFPWLIRHINLSQVGNGSHPWILELRPAQNNGRAIRQRFADRFKGLAAQDNHMPGGHLFEPLEILREMPRDSAALTDHPIERHRSDGFKLFHLPVPRLYDSTF